MPSIAFGWKKQIHRKLAKQTADIFFYKITLLFVFCCDAS